MGSAGRHRPLLLAAVACLLVVGGLLLRGPSESTATANRDPAPPAAADQPNFLHILTDDQTIDSLRYMKRTERLLGERERPSPTTTWSSRFAAPPAPAS